MTMAIRCRHRETFPNTHTHQTVHEVKVCQGVIKPVMPLASVSQNTAEQVHQVRAAKLATLTPRQEPNTTADGTVYGFRVDPALEAAVPAGRYALPRHDDRDGCRFFRVEKPTEGTWAGRTFVKRQAGDDWYPVRDVNTRASILREIGKDVRGALELYGHE